MFLMSSLCCARSFVLLSLPAGYYYTAAGIITFLYYMLCYYYVIIINVILLQPSAGRRWIMKTFPEETFEGVKEQPTALS